MDTSFLREKQAKELRGSRVKLWLMIVLLVGVLYGMFHLSQQRTGSGPGDEREPLVGRKVVSSKLEVSGLDPAARARHPGPLAVSEAEAAKKFAFLNDPKTLDQIEDQSTDIDPNPFFYMLYRLIKEDTHEKLKAEAEETGEVDWPTLWGKSKDMRGKAIQVTGRIVGIWPQGFGQNPTNLKQVTGYRIRSDKAKAEGTDELFDVYVVEKLHGALRHDLVTTYGRYFKAQTIPPDSTRFIEDPDLHVAVILARRFEPLTYLDEPNPPGPITEGNRPEARAFYWFLKRAIAIPPADLKAQATDALTYVDLTTQPERYRGTPIALYGELRSLYRIRLPENPLHLADIFYGQIVDRDRKMNTFYCHQIPDGVRLKDVVTVYGYYMKTWDYTSRDKRIVKSPLVVGKYMAKVVFRRDFTLEIVICVVVGITVVVVLIAHRREAARTRAFAERRRQVQAERAHSALRAMQRDKGGGE